MTDRPILFSAPMVRALLDGRKTQTRRILKLPTKGEYVRTDMGGWEASTVGGEGVFASDGMPSPGRPCVWNQTTGTVVCPQFTVSDRLWVKETWRTTPAYDDLKPSELGGDEPLNYLADDGYFNWAEADGDRHGKTRVSIFMPRWASRLTLTVTDVRVERLRDISDADALAEGVPAVGGQYHDEYDGAWRSCTVAEFRDLWDRINDERDDASWDDNPWVVAITFTTEQRNIDQ